MISAFTISGYAEENKANQPEETGYKDVPLNEYYSYSVVWALENHIINNVLTKEFKPENPCTKGTVATWLWNLGGSQMPKNKTCIYEDVHPHSIRSIAVAWVSENGIMSGINSALFGAENPCTRAEVLTYLWRFNQRPKLSSDKQVFDDVPESSMYFKPIMWAVENDITNGNTETEFLPDETCTRGQLITFIYRSKVKQNLWGKPDENVSDLMISGEECPLKNGVIYGNIIGINPGSTPFMTGAKTLYTNHEGHYDSVAQSDVGTCGGGFMGFRGSVFLRILKIAVNKLGEEKSVRILGQDLYNEIVSEPSNSLRWETGRILTEDEARLIHRLLRTKEGIAAQDEFAEYSIGLQVQAAYANHISSDAAVLYFCSISNHYGPSGAQTFMAKLRQFMGWDENYQITSLDEFHNAVEAASASGVSYIGGTLNYRRKIYNFIKNNLGWY